MAVVWLAEYKLFPVIIQPFVILSGQPADKVEVTFHILAFVFYVSCIFRLDGARHTGPVAYFLYYAE